MAVNIDSLLEIVTQASNALGRAKDALLKEKERAEAPVQERLTAEEWAMRMDRNSDAMQQSRQNARDYVDTPTETKSTTKTSSKNS
jgi:hypothetical protein